MIKINDFKYCEPYINHDLIEQFDGSVSEKAILFSIFSEWNCKRSLSELCVSWYKERPPVSPENLCVLLWNCECLSTHMSDFDLLLSSYSPHIFILTGVGKLIRAL